MNARTKSGHRFIALCLLGASAGAQASTWTQHHPPTAPSVRTFHAMATVGTGALLFGGLNTTSLPPWLTLGDTWFWQADTWTLLPTPVSPPARESAAMVFDSARQRVVLFGGMIVNVYLGDTWQWDSSGWSQVGTPAAPIARARHAMAYDSLRQRTVLFGGSASTGVLGDTWEWNGVSWIMMPSAHVPGPRLRHAMAYDPVRGKTVLFGGADQVVTWLPDGWEWDGVDWTARSAIFPPRSVHAMAYDEHTQRVVMMGGYGPQTATFNMNDDTWTWDGTTAAQLTTPVAPPPRMGHQIAYDASRHGMMLFGGVIFFLAPQADTWALGSTLATAQVYGSGCGNPVLSLSPVFAARPMLGQTARALVQNAPTQVAAVGLGWSNQLFGSSILPLSLSAFGMTGCDLWHSADLLGLPLSPVAGGLEFSLALPNTASLLDRDVYLQAYAFAPGQNPAQITTSNGLYWRLGDF